MSQASAIRSITAAQTRQARHDWLRPHQLPDELVFPGDDAPDSLHAGAFLKDELVGIASVSRESPPAEDNPTAWRLRGMATSPPVRGKGYGCALVEACIAHIAARDGTMVWCHGRTSARRFYEALGFRAIGEEFDVPVTGPHYVMRRDLPLKDWR